MADKTELQTPPVEGQEILAIPEEGTPEFAELQESEQDVIVPDDTAVGEPEGAIEPKGKEEETEEQEGVWQVDGEELTDAEIREAAQARKQKKHWQADLTQRSQQLAERERQLAAREALSQSGLKQDTTQRAVPKKADKMPDPVEDPDGFGEWTERRIEEGIQQKLRQTTPDVEGAIDARLAFANSRAADMAMEREFRAKHRDVSDDDFQQICNTVIGKYKSKFPNAGYPEGCLEDEFKLQNVETATAQARTEGARKVVRTLREKSKARSLGAAQGGETVGIPLEDPALYYAPKYIEQLEGLSNAEQQRAAAALFAKSPAEQQKIRSLKK